MHGVVRVLSLIKLDRRLPDSRVGSRGLGAGIDRVVPAASMHPNGEAEPQAGKRSAGRSFERPALGRTFASYVSVRMGSSSGLSFPVSRPLSALLVPHRCPVGGAVPVKPADVQSAAVSCRERRDVFGSLLRKRGRFLIKWLIFPLGPLLPAAGEITPS